MDVHRNRRLAWLSWLFVGTVAVLAVVLGVLQYRWIGEVSVAERERLRTSLRASLRRLSQDFNGEITAACAALLPPAGETDEPEGYARRYERWKESTRHHRLIRRVALVAERDDSATLLLLDPDRLAFLPVSAWPEGWQALRDRLTQRFSEPGPGPRRFPGPGAEDSLDLIDLPRFSRPEGSGPFPFRQPQGPRGRQGPQGRMGPEGRERDRGRVIVQLDLDYVRGVIIPELVRHHLGDAGRLDYDVEVLPWGDPAHPIYRSAQHGAPIGQHADATANIFQLQYDQLLGRRLAGFRGRDGARGATLRARGGPPPEALVDRGRWELLVRHRTGSLETLVARTRSRNLAVMTSVLLLMLAAIAALMRFTQRSQRLARLEMEFVAGVSHELRTPLSVIRTAAHNLGGGVVSNPKQVQRYGALIEQEAERLTNIVEQVLRFARGAAGKPIGAREPVTVETLVDDALAATARVLEESRCTIEKRVDPDLPPVMADPVSLSHALQNLLTNAAKYGVQGGWIGVFAARAAEGQDGMVEIRVADRGPGIPPDELGQIFDPFYRGKRALEDQIHGTGLGLNLVRRIVEAHQGSVTVESAPGKNTEFLLRIPVAAREQVDEFADTARRG